MDKLFERHDDYMEKVPMDFVRRPAGHIDWNVRLIAIKGLKGTGKSTYAAHKTCSVIML